MEASGSPFLSLAESLHVLIDGLGADAQPFGDLPRGVSFGEKSANLLSRLSRSWISHGVNVLNPPTACQVPCKGSRVEPSTTEGKDGMRLTIKALLLAAALVIVTSLAAKADLEPVQVIWDGTGAANLPCPGGAHWTFDQGVVEGNGIYNVTIHLGPDGVSGWGMATDPTVYPHTFAVDTTYPMDASTFVDYYYTSEESPEALADNHLVLDHCLGTSGTGTTSVPPVPEPATCTRIVGLSFTSQWFPTFESQVDGASWELFWHHGARVNFWAKKAWGGSHYDSACTNHPITRVVYDFSPETKQGPDVTALVVKLRQVVANLKAKFPGAQIVIQPIVGGPADTRCYRAGIAVNATVIHPYAVAAANQVANGTDVVSGLDAHVADCAMYNDTVGHFTAAGSTYIGQQMASFFGGTA